MTLPNAPFASVADTSLRLSVAIIVLRVVQPWLRRWVGSRALAALWLLVAARLLVPWPVASSWGWPSPLALLEGSPARTPTQISSLRVSVTNAHGGTRTPPERAVTTSSARLPTPGGGRPPGWDVWNLVWVAGVGLAAGNLARGCWQIRRWRASSPDEDSRLSRVFASLPNADRRNVGLRITDALDVPTLSGVLRPLIWMPRRWLDDLSDEEIRHVLLHELGHARRADLLAQWLVALACGVHWFNPLVWAMARWARADRELACDAWVLARGGAAQRETFAAEYGGTLIKVVGQACAGTSWRPSPATVAMAAGKRNLTLRVREISAFRSVSAFRGRLALAVAAAAVAGFTVSRAAQTPETPVPASGQTSGPVPAVSSPSPAPVPVVAATPPGSTEHPPQIEIEVKLIEFSRDTLARLKARQRTESPALAAVFDQITASISGKTADSPAALVGVILPKIISPEDFQTFLKWINQVKGADLLSAPRVTMKSGQKATIEVSRELIYPTSFEHNKPGSGKPELTPTNFGKANLGLTMEFEGSFSPARDVLDLNVSWGLTELQGWLRLKDGKPVPDAERPAYDFPEVVQEDHHGKPVRVETRPADAQPVISTHTVKTLVSVAPGNTVMLSGFRRAPGTPRNSSIDDQEINKEETVAVGFFTPRLVDAPAPATGPGLVYPGPSDEPPLSTNNDYPYGAAVKDKPGFITSPYAPDAGYVDVRGFKHGQEVRDPYTGKIFLVP